MDAATHLGKEFTFNPSKANLLILNMYFHLLLL
jgi:hypothetical protein